MAKRRGKNKQAVPTLTVSCITLSVYGSGVWCHSLNSLNQNCPPTICLDEIGNPFADALISVCLFFCLYVCDAFATPAGTERTQLLKELSRTDVV